MKNLTIAATVKTPFVHFDCDKGFLIINGHSCPDDPANYYREVVEWISCYFEYYNQPTTLHFYIEYINTSSSKIFINIFDLLDEFFRKGRDVKVNWFFNSRNRCAMEWGHEFKNDLALPFDIVENDDQEKGRSMW